MPCAAAPLLQPGADLILASYREKYPSYYDEVFDCIRRRVRKNGYASKLDLDALIAWKHVRTARWMRDLNCMTEATVRATTANAFAQSTDRQRVAALKLLKGFGKGGAFTSALLAAWDPNRYGVYDRFALAARTSAVSATCSCSWETLDTYEEHLRQIANELTRQTQTPWTPRHVDMGLYSIGWEADARAREEARLRRREAKRALRGRDGLGVAHS